MSVIPDVSQWREGVCVDRGSLQSGKVIFLVKLISDRVLYVHITFGYGCAISSDGKKGVRERS